MNYLYEESEMPYGILSQYGLTQQMVDDLPMDVLADIYNGRKSPVLPVRYMAEEGEPVEGRTRFALVRNDRDEVDVLFYPVLDEEDVRRLDEQQRKRLSGNRVVVGFVDGEHRITFDADNPLRGTTSFVQLDPESRQVLSVPVQVIGRNLQLIAKNYGLSADQVQKMQNGEVVTVLQDEDPVSIGHHPVPEFYEERHGAPRGHVYFKPGVDSPQDIAARAFDAGVNAANHGVGLGR